MINDRKRHLDYILSLTERKGRHLLWKGPVGFAGLPVLRGGDGNNKSPHQTIYFLRTGKAFPRYRTEGCSEPLCVEPGCFHAPHRHPAPKPPARPREPRQEKPSGDLCSRGHNLAETRMVSEGGRAYCGVCASICPKGHDQSVHGGRRGNGRRYCLLCNREAKSGRRSSVLVA